MLLLETGTIKVDRNYFEKISVEGDYAKKRRKTGRSRRNYLRKPEFKSTVTFSKGPLKKRKFLKRIPLINFFGAAALELSGVLLFFFPLILLPVLSDVPEYGELSEISKTTFLCASFVACLYSMSLGNELLCDAKYVKTARCRRCARQFAYEEQKIPDIKEVSTRKSYSVTVIRYWKCKYCGYEDSTESPENIMARKGEKQGSSKLSKIACTNCGIQGSYKEFKKPDEKIVDDFFSTTTTTTRYYNCKTCGHVDIKVETEKRSHNF